MFYDIEPRVYHCALAYQDRYVFLIGGTNLNFDPISTCLLFDSETLTFTAVFNLEPML
jgi:Galactose oxidase, central domain